MPVSTIVLAEYTTTLIIILIFLGGLGAGQGALEFALVLGVLAFLHGYLALEEFKLDLFLTFRIGTDKLGVGDQGFSLSAGHFFGPAVFENAGLTATDTDVTGGGGFMKLGHDF